MSDIVHRVDISRLRSTLMQWRSSGGWCSYDGYNSTRCCTDWQEGDFIEPTTVQDIIDEVRKSAVDPIGRFPYGR